jgi:hypothetical protein
MPLFIVLKIEVNVLKMMEARKATIPIESKGSHLLKLEKLKTWRVQAWIMVDHASKKYSQILSKGYVELITISPLSSFISPCFVCSFITQPRLAIKLLDTNVISSIFNGSSKGYN